MRRPGIHRPAGRLIRAGTVAMLLVIPAPSALGAGSGRHSAPPAPSATPLLVSRAALGAGWSVNAPAPTRVPQITCHGLSTALTTAHRTAAAGPTFAQASAGPYVQQTAYRWATVATATAVWRQVARPALLSCLARSLLRGGSSGVTFAVTGRHAIRAPRLPVGIRAYRVLAAATIGGQSFPAYLDELVINTGGSISEISVASYEQPPPSSVETRVATAVVRQAAAVNRRTARR